MSWSSSSAWAKDILVNADANGNGGGVVNSLAAAEAASGPGDTIYILPSHTLLDGGIQLKDGQSLIGLGTDVTSLHSNAAHAQLTNSSGAHLGGDAVRLANNNTVRNIHVTGAFRGGILGINVAEATIDGNLITNNMNQHTPQDLQTNFVIFQAQRNHYGAITFFGCGPAASSQCTPQDPSSPGTATQHATIRNNVIKDVLAEGIMILTDTGINAAYDVEGNSVDGVSLHYPGFLRTDLLPPLVPEVIRSRAFTTLVGNHANTYVNMNHFNATHLAPPGDWASDGVVFVTYGEAAVVSADVRNVTVTNPDFTGEIVNGDTLEMTAFGSDSTFDVRVRDCDLQDSVSTIVKMLGVAAFGNNNSWFVDIADTKLTNKNPRVAVEASNGTVFFEQIPLPGSLTTGTIDVKLHNVVMTGHRRSIFTENLGLQMTALNLFVEDSVLENNTNEGFRLLNTGHIASTAIDLGGGPLGSEGRNSIINNGTQPSDADAAAINTGAGDPHITVFASNNYWGGGAPVTGPGQNLFAVGNASFVVNGFLTEDPNICQ